MKILCIGYLVCVGCLLLWFAVSSALERRRRVRNVRRGERGMHFKHSGASLVEMAGMLK